MAKSVKLSIKPSFDFILIGIVSSEPIYKISYLINSKLNLNLKEHEAVKIFNQKLNGLQRFEFFNSFNTETEESFELIRNKGAQGVLIEEQKQVDYWFKIENSFLSESEIISSLKTIKNISLTFGVKPDSLKSKNKLIFSFDE